MRKAVIYARFSSDKQDEASIDAQVRACREYAAGKGYAVLDIYADEAVSGKGSKTASRKAYQRMLRDADKGLFDTILIHKYDRVARNLGEHVSLEKRLKDHRVELIAVAQDFGSTAEAKIMRTLIQERIFIRPRRKSAGRTGGASPTQYGLKTPCRRSSARRSLWRCSGS